MASERKGLEQALVAKDPGYFGNWLDLAGVRS